MAKPTSHPAISPDAFRWSLEAISRDQRVPLSAATMLREFPPPHDLASVELAARAMGVRARMGVRSSADLRAANASCFVVLRTGAETKGNAAGIAAAEGQRLARIVRFDSGAVVLHGSGDAAETTLTPSEFDEIFTGHALELIGPERAADDAHDDPIAQEPFGLRWFGREMLRYPGVWRDVLLAATAVQLLALVVPLLTQVIIDKVIVHRTVNTLLVVAAALILATAFSSLIGWIRQYLVLHTGTRIDAVLASRVFSHLMRLPPRYFERRPTGVLVARMHGVETIREFLAGAALTLVLDLPFMLVFAAIMFYYSPTLTWIALGMLVVLIAASVAVTPVLRRRIDRQFLAGARQQSFVTEYLAGIETVKSLQLEPQLRQRYQALFADYLAAGFAARRLANTFHAFSQFLEQLLAITVLCVGAWLVISGADLTIGALIAFQMFAGRLAAPMMRIAGLWQEFQQVDVAVRRQADIMDVPPEPVEPNPARGRDSAGRLECRELAFRYREDRPWLFRGLTFTMTPGACVALIGPSGSGKSTLARLLQGFYAPSEGSISIDGVDIRHLAANELRSCFGVVPQETRLFSGSILQNMIDANPNASFEEVMEACRYARIDEVIEAMPEGYATRIGENGVGLSGGQKQRLAIARALLKQPRILVFDEATASLDAELARAVVETVNGLRERVGVLFIAHELPEGLRCDRVVRLDAGAGTEEVT